jgi:hypothetical protein
VGRSSQREYSSFSEEKEAKRLSFLCAALIDLALYGN